jgi:hypothetical protein
MFETFPLECSDTRLYCLFFVYIHRRKKEKKIIYMSFETMDQLYDTVYDQECPICLEDYHTYPCSITLTCAHLFRDTIAFCPNCRTSLPEKELQDVSKDTLLNLVPLRLAPLRVSHVHTANTHCQQKTKQGHSCKRKPQTNKSIFNFLHGRCK